jgi:hypothetical protein
VKDDMFDAIITQAKQTVGADRVLAGHAKDVSMLVGPPSPDVSVRLVQARETIAGRLVFNPATDCYEMAP